MTLVLATTLAACQDGVVDIDEVTTTEDPCAASTAIELGQSLFGTLGEGDCPRGGVWTDRWSLELSSETPVRIDLSSSSFDAYLELRRVGSGVVAENDDAGSLDARIIETLPAGSYVIVARSLGEGGTGGYTLSVAVGPDCRPVGTIDVGQTVSGRIGAGDCLFEWGGLIHNWTLELTRTTRLRLEVVSPTFDEGLIIRDERGEIVLVADGLGPIGFARADIELPAGAWEISAASIFEEPGDYELTVDLQPPCSPGSTLLLDQTVSGSIEDSDCLFQGWAAADSFALELERDTPIEIVVKSSEIRPFFSVLDPNGVEVAFGFQDFDPTTGRPTGIARTSAALDAGTYALFVAADGYPSPYGDYQITVSEIVCDASTDLSSDTTVVGSLGPGDCLTGDGGWKDSYAVIVPADATVRIDLESSAFDAFLVLRDGTGATLESDDDDGAGLDARIERTLSAGTYIVEASSRLPGSGGSYTLTLAPVPAAPVAPPAGAPLQSWHPASGSGILGPMSEQTGADTEGHPLEGLGSR